MRDQLDEARGADVVHVPPPLYVVVGFVAGLLLDGPLPLPMGGRPATMLIGAAVAGSAPFLPVRLLRLARVLERLDCGLGQTIWVSTMVRRG